jgi:hypothetical protein
LGHVALQRKGVKRLIRRFQEIYPQMPANRERIGLCEGCARRLNALYDGMISMKKQRAKADVPDCYLRLISQVPMNGSY